MENKFRKGLTSAVLFILVISTGSISAFAATTPSLGAADPYGVLASTYTNTVAGATINGDVGFTTGPAITPGGTHINYGSGAPYATAGTAQGATLSALSSQLCTFTFGGGAINLSTDITHGSAGIYTPGVYCSSGAMNIGGPLNLNGSGTYIFRPAGALTSTAGAVVTLTSGCANDVFWTPTQATTLAANTTFVGNVISDAGITIGANTTWTGRALAFGGTVTTDTDTITVPTCTAAPIVEEESNPTGTINIVKTVVNDNGRTKTVADFPLFINGISVISGVTNIFAANSTYTVTETSDPNYTATFSGDCDSTGHMLLTPASNKFCIITNNDIAPASSGGSTSTPPVPPLIDVVKVPSPLALPDGPGTVKYTYTLRNTGTVPVTDITMVGDTCSPIILESGDTNSDAKLDINETWVHTCSTRLTETHTNTVVATGWANGISATDIASATVIVGEPIVPPLIHVTKIPSSLTLLVGGGMVTYTEIITNPGTVALSNVSLTDDKCSPVNYISGDRDNDSKLDTNETWRYICRKNLTKTTTNIATATGEANDLTVRDLATATVVVATTPAVAVPKLPNTGLPTEGKSITWNIVMLSGLFLLASASLGWILKKS
jgi:uncharacterized repeat protein (TIGR01451 family)